MSRLRARGLLAGVLLGLCAPVATSVLAQEQDVLRAPVLMLDRNRLFSESEFGRAAEARFQAESQALIAENLRLEQALEAEERTLTDQRSTLDAAAFQDLATAFDEKTEAIRAAQDTKSRALTASRDEDRQRFLQAAVPILGELMRETGAVAIFDKDMVILSLRGADITDEAIKLIDAALGDGSALPAVPTPETAPEAGLDGAADGAEDGTAGGTAAP
jgi:Skp family chaperone for outer membrane proteins